MPQNEDCSSVIRIDGENFGVGLIKIERSVDVLDKMAKRTINGDLKREILGVYFNYRLTFGPFFDMEQYSKLFNKLTEKKEFHVIQIPTNQGVDIYRGYIAKVKDTIEQVKDNKRFVTGLTFDLVSKAPKY